jgi:hypothetical protein
MLKYIKSLRFFITVSFATVLIGVFITGLIRRYGMSQEYAAHRHPLMSTPRPWVIADSSWVASQSPAELRSTCAARPNLWLKLDLFVPLPESPPNAEPSPEAPRFALKMKVGEELRDPSEFVASIGSACRWMFSLQSNVANVDKLFIAWVEQMQLNTSFAVQSPYDLILKTLKEQNPLGVFVSGTREPTRLSIAAQLFVESAVPLPSDVILINPYFQNQWVLQDGIRQEVQRRNKVFCLGPLTDTAKWKELRDQGFDCVLTNAPLEFTDL